MRLLAEPHLDHVRRLRADSADALARGATGGIGSRRNHRPARFSGRARRTPAPGRLAEVIASAFASGFSWGGDAAGKRAYCAPPDLKGPQIMGAFEAFVRDNPALAEGRDDGGDA